MDFDVHHGNGTQDIFWGDETVLYSSTHQMPLYPGTGAVSETGLHDNIVNAPLRAGDGGEAFREAIAVDPEFLLRAQRWCRETGALFCLDEIQTGFGRTGKWFGFQHFGLEPDLIALAKGANPPLAYASGGNGSQHHLTMEMLKARAGFDMLHVPYKGGTPATTATIGGETVAMFSGTSNATLIKAGKLHALATTGKLRSKALPDVPTIGESFPGFENTIWIGLFAPTGTPPAVVQKLREEISKALNAPDLIEGFQKAGGIEPLQTSLEEMQQMIKRDQARYSKIIRELQLKVD